MNSNAELCIREFEIAKLDQSSINNPWLVSYVYDVTFCRVLKKILCPARGIFHTLIISIRIQFKEG